MSTAVPLSEYVRGVPGRDSRTVQSNGLILRAFAITSLRHRLANYL